MIEKKIDRNDENAKNTKFKKKNLLTNECEKHGHIELMKGQRLVPLGKLCRLGFQGRFYHSLIGRANFLGFDQFLQLEFQSFEK